MGRRPAGLGASGVLSGTVRAAAGAGMAAGGEAAARGGASRGVILVASLVVGGADTTNDAEAELQLSLRVQGTRLRYRSAGRASGSWPAVAPVSAPLGSAGAARAHEGWPAA
ncbi:hypothetical protein SBRY_50467 [Actinacidiphila bryophytorum]|uniref:Uncharacterized protein n=1 Tax=Actinacidiphila bryophytorum TaxID=1436133 RepID=A0A9W4H4Z1_9ACTN|nr:hypothetical protein SBRY_50467 [Actinacidiphila bryophytorum]